MMRPFGTAEDLDLDLSHVDRPHVVTTLLTQCAGPDAAFWWSQPVGIRIAALLRVVAVTEQRDSLTLTSTCSACGERFDFDLPIRLLEGVDAGRDPLPVQLAADRQVIVRCATGDDLRRWQEAQPSSGHEALRLMLESLVIDGVVTPEDEDTLAVFLGERDPLVDFSASCRCPGCGATSDVAVDLETLALAQLAGRQREAIDEVHRLATHYGWTESEVLSLPRHRRARYLALVEGRA